jgi:hypothetical protein
MEVEMGTMDDFFIADGENGFTATGSGIGHRTWFVYPEPLFAYGAQFQGWFYGTIGAGGATDPNNKFGPDTNSYSDFAGVFGTGAYVTGVAGTSINNVGVYGQTEEDPNSSIPKIFSAGVFGAANTGSGVVGWSTTWNGVEGWAYQHTAVLGVSEIGYGVQGASTWQPGVLGASDNDAGVYGLSDPEQQEGPAIPNPVTIAGVVGTSVLYMA